MSKRLSVTSRVTRGSESVPAHPLGFFLMEMVFLTQKISNESREVLVVAGVGLGQTVCVRLLYWFTSSRAWSPEKRLWETVT